MTKKEKWREHLRSLAVGVLLLILICLSVIYILSFSGAEDHEFSAEDMEAVSSESTRYQYLDYWNSNYIAPSFIGFSSKKHGENIGFHTLGGANADVYESVSPFIEKLFGSEGESELLSPEKGSSLFHALLKGDYIYVSYICDLPSSLILSMTQDDVFNGDTGEYIRELLIVPSEYLWKKSVPTPNGETVLSDLYSFYALARDSQGNYYRYTTEYLPTDGESIAFHTNFYLTYNEAENRLPYEFAYLWQQDTFLRENGFSEKVSDTTVIPLSGAPYEAPIVFAESRIASGTDINPILESFFMNPEKITSYTDDLGTVFYFDEGRNISISTDGDLLFSAHGEEGIPLETLFGWKTGEETYDAFDHIGASIIAAERLREAHTPTNCKPYISGIHYDGEKLTVSFGYAAGGMPIYFNGNNDIISFSFSADTLQSAEYRFWTVHTTALTDKAPDLAWSLRSYLLTEEKQQYYFYGYYFSNQQSRTGADILKIPS